MAGIPYIAAALIVVSLACPTGALRFDLQPGQTKCISEDIKINSMSVGKYSVINPAGPDSHVPLPDSHRITVRVTSPYGNSVHYAENVAEGNFAFTVSESGDHLACFWTHDYRMAAAGPGGVIGFDFEWKSGVAAKNWGSVAKKGQIELMELELKKLEDSVQAIHDEMLYLRTREEEMQNMNASTSSKMAWLSICSLVVCLTVAGLQLFHLKSFFERKKLL